MDSEITHLEGSSPEPIPFFYKIHTTTFNSSALYTAEFRAQGENRLYNLSAFTPGSQAGGRMP